MEFLMELVIDLLLDGSVEVAKSRKISKWIRYPVIAMLAILYVVTVAVIALVAWIVLKNGSTFWLGVGLLVLDLAFVMYSMRKIRREINARKIE